MEALLLAGGKAERMGEAAQGLPKPLVPVAGYPLAEYTVGRLVAAGVTRIIVACRGGQEDVFVNALTGLGAEIDPIGEPEPLGRGGGLKLAASRRQETGPVLALNGDELLDVDFAALLDEHARTASRTVSQSSMPTRSTGRATGSQARTSAPSASRRYAITRLGASRMSSVFGLNASPSSATFLPRSGPRCFCSFCTTRRFCSSFTSHTA